MRNGAKIGHLLLATGADFRHKDGKRGGIRDCFKTVATGFWFSVVDHREVLVAGFRREARSTFLVGLSLVVFVEALFKRLAARNEGNGGPGEWLPMQQQLNRDFTLLSVRPEPLPNTVGIPQLRYSLDLLNSHHLL